MGVLRMKYMIFDSSSIITLAMNNLLHILDKLSEDFDGKFCIPPRVKIEVVDTPLKTKKFEFEALNILSLLQRGVLEVVDLKDLVKDNNRIKTSVNSLFIVGKNKLKIMHDGESSCIALANGLIEEGHDVLLVVDERTTRMLIESPENLRKLFETKLHTKVDMRKINLSFLDDLKVIRSSELSLVAYKNGFIELPASKSQAIDALLYTLKYKGCSISYEEIEDAKTLF
jgi:predicted nucleic acid-binding protein